MPSALSRCAPLTRALQVLVGCALLAGPTPTLHAAAGEPDELSALCKVESLPPDIRGSLTRNFSSWKIQEPADLSPRARTRWGEARPLTCPGIAAGHFQDAKNASYALLLIPANHANSSYKVLIYTQQSGQQYYGFKAVAQVDSGASDVFVQTVATGSFPEATARWVAHSKVNEAVMLVDSGSSASYLFVWSDVNYEREQVNYQ
jgi:hypothetical protein